MEHPPPPEAAHICLKPVLTKEDMFPGDCSPAFLLILCLMGGLPLTLGTMHQLVSLVATSSTLFSGAFCPVP